MVNSLTLNTTHGNQVDFSLYNSEGYPLLTQKSGKPDS